MQSLLFVFIGLPGKNSTADLYPLMNALNEKFQRNNVAVLFSKKDELLSARFNEVSFYISFLKTKDELKDWKEMAKNFNLKFINNPVNKTELLSLYKSLQKSSSNYYKESHFDIAIEIIEELEKFSDMSIYSFQ